MPIFIKSLCLYTLSFWLLWKIRRNVFQTLLTSLADKWSQSSRLNWSEEGKTNQFPNKSSKFLHSFPHNESMYSLYLSHNSCLKEAQGLFFLITTLKCISERTLLPSILSNFRGCQRLPLFPEVTQSQQEVYPLTVLMLACLPAILSWHIVSCRL